MPQHLISHQWTLQLKNVLATITHDTGRNVGYKIQVSLQGLIHANKTFHAIDNETLHAIENASHYSSNRLRRRTRNMLVSLWLREENLDHLASASPVSFAATEERLADGTYDRTAPAMADANSLEGIPSALANALILSSTLSSLALLSPSPPPIELPSAHACDLLPRVKFHHPTSALCCTIRYEKKAPRSVVSPQNR